MDNTVNEDSTILHELLHLFGAPDHYGIKCPTTEEKNNELIQSLPDGMQLNDAIAYHEDCLFGENNHNQADSFHLCNGCKNDIRNHLNLN